MSVISSVSCRLSHATTCRSGRSGFYADKLNLTPKYLTTGHPQGQRDVRLPTGSTVFVILEGEEPAEIFDAEHSGDSLQAQFPEPVLFRQVFQEPHGTNAIGIPYERLIVLIFRNRQTTIVLLDCYIRRRQVLVGIPAAVVSIYSLPFSG